MSAFCLDCGSEVCVYDDQRILVPEQPAEPRRVADLRAGDTKRLAEGA